MYLVWNTVCVQAHLVNVTNATTSGYKINNNETHNYTYHKQSKQTGISIV